jgi:hypothetical protein
MVGLWQICELLGPIHDVSMFLFHYDGIYELGLLFIMVCDWDPTIAGLFFVDL